MFGITARPVRLSAQERAQLARNAANAQELKTKQYDIQTRAQNGMAITYHYLRRGRSLHQISHTIEQVGR